MSPTTTMTTTFFSHEEHRRRIDDFGSKLLKAMHKGTEHVGKLPQRAHREIELDDRMRALAEDLEKAVAEENYESAAALRDQIKQLEHEKAV